VIAFKRIDKKDSSMRMERFFEEEWEDGEAGEVVWEGGRRGGLNGRVGERFFGEDERFFKKNGGGKGRVVWEG